MHSTKRNHVFKNNTYEYAFYSVTHLHTTTHPANTSHLITWQTKFTPMVTLESSSTSGTPLLVRDMDIVSLLLSEAESSITRSTRLPETRQSSICNRPATCNSIGTGNKWNTLLGQTINNAVTDLSNQSGISNCSSSRLLEKERHDTNEIT